MTPGYDVRLLESLQRGRRCSRRRGKPKQPRPLRLQLLQRGRRCSRRRGRWVFPSPAKPTCFNEAGVVHAGEVERVAQA